MHPVLLIDFGSTCTKLTAVDVEARKVLASAEDFTTAFTDISVGLGKALQSMEQKIGKLDYRARLACSSAAGGLRMVACGLVPELTAKAARFAAFGAGAKVIKTYSYELTDEDAREIEEIAPDILLLVGGTDGGNSEVVTKNAQVIAGLKPAFPVVFAGNRGAKAACEAALTASEHPYFSAENVMPTFGKINVAPVQQVIREIFLQRIIQFKGLSHFQDVLDNIMMPTPAAVLSALTLLSEGIKGQRGLGELMAVDLGGATTDVYSIASGAPTNPTTFVHGLREPYVKRTVEGDIGMRYSAHGVVEAAGIDEVMRLSGLSEEEIQQMLSRIGEDPSILPSNGQEARFDLAIAALAIRLGFVRHAGSLQQVYTPAGPVYQQEGKDLTQIRRVIMTGGALIHADAYLDIMQAAIQVNDPARLTPRSFSLIRDERYILSAMGLLADYDKEAAFDILYQYFGKEESYATCEQEMAGGSLSQGAAEGPGDLAHGPGCHGY